MCWGICLKACQIAAAQKQNKTKPQLPLKKKSSWLVTAFEVSCYPFNVFGTQVVTWKVAVHRFTINTSEIPTVCLKKLFYLMTQLLNSTAYELRWEQSKTEERRISVTDTQSCYRTIALSSAFVRTSARDSRLPSCKVDGRDQKEQQQRE